MKSEQNWRIISGEDFLGWASLSGTIGNIQNVYLSTMMTTWQCVTVEEHGQETKRCLYLGRKAMTNVDSVLKSREITLPTKAHLVKTMFFPAVMYGCESWTIKKIEHQRLDAFKLWYWRRRLRVPWTARRVNQSILKEINPEYSFEGLMLKLKLQYSGHFMWRANSLERCWWWKRLKVGGERDDRGWDSWMTSVMQWA